MYGWLAYTSSPCVLINVTCYCFLRRRVAHVPIVVSINVTCYCHRSVRVAHVAFREKMVRCDVATYFSVFSSLQSLFCFSKIIRIQSRSGTKRIDVSEQETTAIVYEKVKSKFVSTSFSTQNSFDRSQSATDWT